MEFIINRFENGNNRVVNYQNKVKGLRSYVSIFIGSVEEAVESGKIDEDTYNLIRKYPNEKDGEYVGSIEIFEDGSINAFIKKSRSVVAFFTMRIKRKD